MKYEEKIMDLFSVGNDYHLAHCISSDFAMGAGIVLEFNRRFNMKNILRNKYYNYVGYWDFSNNKGFCIKEGRVLNLITKRLYWQKPTITTLTNALIEMRKECINNGIKKIAMPLIGCGLDRLSWNDVSNAIKTVFNNTDIEILVCKR